MNSRPDEAVVAAGVEQSLAWIDRLAWVSLVFTTSAAAARIFGENGTAIIGISIPVQWTFSALWLITLAHFFISSHIIRSCADAWLNLSNTNRNSLFDKVVRTGGIITKGSGGYRNGITVKEDSLILKTEIADQPTWMHFTLIFTTLFSTVNLELTLLSLSQFCFSMAVLLTNWKIGESWILCLGDLGSRDNKSSYFRDGTGRPLVLLHMSGPISWRTASFKGFLGDSIFQAAFYSFCIWIILLIPFFAVSGIILIFKSLYK